MLPNKSKNTVSQTDIKASRDVQIGDTNIFLNITYIEEGVSGKKKQFPNINNSENVNNYYPNGAVTMNLAAWIRTIPTIAPTILDKILSKDFDIDQIMPVEANSLKIVESIADLQKLIKTFFLMEQPIEFVTPLAFANLTVQNNLHFYTALLIELVFAPKEALGNLKWIIKETISQDSSKRLKVEDNRILQAFWDNVLNYCCSESEFTEPILQRIIKGGIEKANKTDSSSLYLFFNFILCKVGSNDKVIEKILTILRNHLKESLNDITYKPKYSEKLAILINKTPQILKMTANMLNTTLLKIDSEKNEGINYNFEVMQLPLTNAQYSTLTGHKKEINVEYPFLFSNHSSFMTQLKNIIDSCREVEIDDSYIWDLPTLYEWFIFSSCLKQPYPWGKDTPTSELANLSFGEAKPTRKLKVSAAHKKGASKYGVIDCCGNIHELTYFNMSNNINAIDLRLMGGCYMTNSNNASCHIVRKFVQKENDNRKNIGIRLIRIKKEYGNQRKEDLDNFIKSDLSKRQTSQIGNLKPLY